MPATLSDIEAILDGEGLKYTRSEDYLRISFGTESYRDAEGEPSLFLIIRLEEGGEYFKLMAPNLYSFHPASSGEAFFKALLMVSWRTKLVQFEYDEADGELRAIIEFPLEDATLSKRQLLRCLNGMVQIIDDYHGVIMGALRNGTVDFGPDGRPDELGRQAEEIYALLGVKPGLGRDKLELEE